MNRSVPMIADIQIKFPFRVFDVNVGRYIYEHLDLSAPGDLPVDVGCLPVAGLHMLGQTLYIDTTTDTTDTRFW